jgi:hypothetical protein
VQSAGWILQGDEMTGRAPGQLERIQDFSGHQAL